jgi:uncharacterized linocin/CFP29 family protein
MNQQTIIVGSDKTTIGGTQTASISFTLSEASTDFNSSDVTVIGGTLSNFQGSGVNYTATFAPAVGAASAAVVVSSDRFSDAAGNLNKDGAETNNAVSLTIDSTPSDKTAPTIIVTSDKETLSSTQTATISFTLSESSTDFTLSDATVIGGSLSNFQGSGANYVATFTPIVGATSAAVVVSSDRFSDAAGNLNQDGAEINNAVSLTIDTATVDTTAPTIIVTSDKTTLSGTQTAAISFTLSEASTDFNLSDVTIIGGTLSNFQGGGTSYSATFTPTVGESSAAVVVSSDRFSDAAGNLNQDGAEINNAVSLTIDTAAADTAPPDKTPPTIIVTSDKTMLSGLQSAVISFTLSESSNDFTLSDVTLIGGTLSNFQGSDTNYTAIFKPSAGATSAAVVVSSDRFSDPAGHLNKDGAETNNAVSLTIDNGSTAGDILRVVDNGVGLSVSPVLGGLGDDVIEIDHTQTGYFSRTGAFIYGGPGLDTFKLTGSEQVLDLAALMGGNKEATLQSVEVIDITGTGNNMLKLSLNDVLRMGHVSAFAGVQDAVNSVQMKIDGNVGDTLELKDLVAANDPGVWVQASNYVANGNTYKVFNYAPLNAQLLVDADIQHTLVMTGSL